jgi:tetratricopeptide (TPR) repeat protein
MTTIVREPTRLLIFFLLASCAALAAPDFHQLIQEGQEALAKSDIARAEKFFAKACSGASGEALTPDERASCDHHLAIVDEARGNTALAEERLLRALSEWEQAGDNFRAAYARSLLNLGELYRKQHRLADAEARLLRAAELARGIRADYPQVYAEALSRLGGVYAESENPGRGRPLLAEAIGIFRGFAPDEDAEEAHTFDALGMIDLVAGRTGDAQASLREAVSLSALASGEDHPETAGYQSDLAFALIQDHQYDRADPLLKRARFVLESRPGPDRSRLGIIFAQLSMVACGRNKFALAESYARQSLALLEPVAGSKSAVNEGAAGALARVSLGAVYLRQHRIAEAERVLPDTVATERRVAPNTCLLADSLRELAELRALQQSWVEAAELYRESLELYRSILGPDHPGLVPVERAYGLALKHRV